MTIAKILRFEYNNIFVMLLFKELRPKNFDAAYILYINKIRLVTISESKKKVLNKNVVWLLFKVLWPKGCLFIGNFLHQDIF